MDIVKVRKAFLSLLKDSGEDFVTLYELAAKLRVQPEIMRTFINEEPLLFCVRESTFDQERCRRTPVSVPVIYGVFTDEGDNFSTQDFLDRLVKANEKSVYVARRRMYVEDLYEIGRGGVCDVGWYIPLDLAGTPSPRQYENHWLWRNTWDKVQQLRRLRVCGKREYEYHTYVKDGDCWGRPSYRMEKRVLTYDDGIEVSDMISLKRMGWKILGELPYSVL